MDNNSPATEYRGTRPNGRQVAYAGFISYSHAADGLLAPKLQAGLQRFAKPWWKRRAVRVFRDESSLSANPHLWSSITDALDSSGWFVLLLSPDAASSEWVNEEIAYWKTHRDPSRIMPVVTNGQFGWAGGDVIGDAVPDALKGVFEAEPRWVDLRFAKGEEQLDLNNPRFLAAVADIASALRGVPKDELESEEVRQHHRTVRTAWTGGIVVLLLAVAATFFGIQSADNARTAETEAVRANQEAQRAEAEATRAEQQADRATAEAERANASAALATARELALSSRLIADEDPELGILLALESIAATGEAEAEPLPESLSALWHSFARHRVELAIPGAGRSVSAFSPDGTLLATDMESDQSAVVFWDSSTGDEVGRLPGPDLDGVFVTDIVFDENLVYVARSWPEALQLDLVPAVVAYDIDSLEEVASFPGPPGGYPDMDVSERGDVSALVGNEGPAIIWPAADPGSPVILEQDAITFLGDGSLVLGPRDRADLTDPLADLTSPFVVVDWQSGTEVSVLDIPRFGGRFALSPDGARLAVGGYGGLFGVFDIATETAVWPTSPRSFTDPQQISWSEDGTRIAVSGNDADVTIIDAETGEIELVLSGHHASVFSTAWHPSGEKLASIAHGNQDTRIWDLRPEGPEVRGFIAVRGAGGVFDGDRMRLLYNAYGIGADLIDPETGTVESLDLLVENPRNQAFMSEDGTFVVGLDQTGAGVIVDVASGETTHLPECALPRGISSNGSYVAVEVQSTCDREEFPAGVIELATGTHIIGLPDNRSVWHADFTRVGPTNREFMALSEVPYPDNLETEVPDELQLWALDPLELVFSIPHTELGVYFLRARFSHDGRYLGVGTNGGRAALIDVEAALVGGDDYIVLNWEAHSGNTPMAVPSDIGLVATASFDGFYRIWSIDTGELVMEIEVPGGEGFFRPTVVWSADGSTLYYTLDSQTIGRLPIDPAAMIELAESAVTRSLTDDECRQYLHTEGCG